MRDFGNTRHHIPPSAAGVIARLAYARARREGVDADTLLRKAGLSHEQVDNPDARLQVKNQVKFLDLVAAAVNDDLLGFHLSLDFDLRAAGLLYYVVASSDTLEEALRRGARCSSIVNESISIKVHKRSRIHFVFEHVGVARRSDQHQIEFWVAALIRACRQITNRHVTADCITFAHRRRATPELRMFFGSKIKFGANMDEVKFSRSIRNIAVVFSDPYLNKLLVEYCEEALAGRRVRSSFGTGVESTIALLLPHGEARMNDVARKLGVSPKTLARRLASEGLTFGGLLREVRIHLANRHLADKELSISKIAWLLGYQHVSAFTSAFKRWTGRGPRIARREAR